MTGSLMHSAHKFRRSQTGGYPRSTASLTTWRGSTVRSLRAPKAIDAGHLPRCSPAGVDLALVDQFARLLAGQPCDHLGVSAGAARLPATNPNRAAGRPVPLRVRPRATNAFEEQSSAARPFQTVIDPADYRR